MRFPLWSRLFLAFALLCIAGLGVLTLLQKLNFQRDFLEYLNERAKARVVVAAAELGRRYERNGDWSFVMGRGRQFDAIIRGDVETVGATESSALDPEFRPRRELWGPEGPRYPGKGGGSGIDKKGPREGDYRGGGPKAPPVEGFREPRKGYGPREGPPTKRINALDLSTRVSLVGEDGRLVIGNPAVPMTSPSVAVMAAGREVGRLLIAPQPALEGDFDLAFVRSQTQHAWMAALAVLLGALVAAWFLARWLLAPVKTLNTQMRALAAGNFDGRIETKRTDELGELAQSFNRLAETLARNQDARRAWGTDIAHELRTPLAILRGEIQALEDGIRPLTKDAMASLQSECARLTSLVEDLYQLSLSDVGALEYRFEVIDLNRIVADAHSEMGRLLEDAGLTISLQPATAPILVRADARRMMQLLTNLLTNSGRYTDAPGKVLISTCEQKGRAMLIIDDTPPGVPAELVPRLFDRLFRVESSRNRAVGGAGLGLAICQNIATAHQGTLSADSSPLGGLRMTLSLPLANASAQVAR